jgi:hypothetical protein
MEILLVKNRQYKRKLNAYEELFDMETEVSKENKPIVGDLGTKVPIEPIIPKVENNSSQGK